MARIPFKSRLPREAWVLAAVGLAFSIASSLAHGSTEPDRALPQVAKTIPAICGSGQAGVISVALPQDCPDVAASQEQHH